MHDLGMIGGADTQIGADDDGYPWIFGYRGPSLSKLTDRQIVPVRAFIEDRLMTKSPAELRLIAKAASGATWRTRCCSATPIPARPKRKSASAPATKPPAP